MFIDIIIAVKMHFVHIFLIHKVFDDYSKDITDINNFCRR